MPLLCVYTFAAHLRICANGMALLYSPGDASQHRQLPHDRYSRILAHSPCALVHPRFPDRTDRFFFVLFYQAPPPSYVATMRFTIGVNADPNVTGSDPILGAYQASEYIRDDFVEILGSQMFANDVNATLNDPVPQNFQRQYRRARSKNSTASCP